MGSGGGFHIIKLLSVCGAFFVEISPVKDKVLTNKAGDGCDGNWPEIIEGLWVGSFRDGLTYEIFQPLEQVFCDNDVLMIEQRGMQVQGQILCQFSWAGQWVW